MSESSPAQPHETDASSESTVTRPRPLPITVSERPEASWPVAASDRSERLVHAIAAAVIAATAAYLLWRVAFTISSASAVLGIPLVILEAWSLVSLTLNAFALWRLDTVARPEPVDETTHTVAVLIPSFDESHQVLMPTLSAATRMRLATHIIVLDDGHRSWLAGMCDELGIEYRPRIGQDHDTAAQLNVALAGLDTDFVVVLEPDQVVDREFIGRTLPHFDDDLVALVQTPRDAYNTDSFEHIVQGKEHIDEQDAAERLLGSGRNRWNAVEWLGGGAILRATALDSIGGAAAGTAAHGIDTTIRLHEAGWRTVQHDEILVRGRAAADAGEYRARVGRSAAGDLQVLRRNRFLTGRGLSMAQRVSHLSVLTRGLDAWRTLGYLVLPPMVLLLALTPVSGPVVAFALLFVLLLALRKIALRSLGRGRVTRLHARSFSILGMPARLRATTTLLTGRIPRAFGPDRREDEPRHVSVLLWILVALNGAGLAWAIATGLGLTAMSYEYAVIAIGAGLWSAVNLVLLLRAIARIRSSVFGGDRRQSHRIDVEGHVFLDGLRVHVLDLSLTGVRLLSYGDVPELDSYCTMAFTDPNRRAAVVTGTVVGIDQRPHGQEIRIDLEPDQTYVLGAILAEALIRTA